MCSLCRINAHLRHFAGELKNSRTTFLANQENSCAHTTFYFLFSFSEVLLLPLILFCMIFSWKSAEKIAISDLLKNYFSPKMTPEIRNKKDECGLLFLFSTKVNFTKMAHSTVLHWPASFDSQYFGETGHSAELWLINPWPLYFRINRWEGLVSLKVILMVLVVYRKNKTLLKALCNRI